MNNAILSALTLNSLTTSVRLNQISQVMKNFNSYTIIVKKSGYHEKDDRPLVNISGWFFHTRVLLSISTMQ